MKVISFRRALPSALLAVALSTSAQQMKIESQGEAAVEAQKEALVAMSMSKAIGLPVAGKGQVVFFRASTSPGAVLDIHADGDVVGDLPAGGRSCTTITMGVFAYRVNGPFGCWACRCPDQPAATSGRLASNVARASSTYDRDDIPQPCPRTGASAPSAANMCWHH